MHIYFISLVQFFLFAYNIAYTVIQLDITLKILLAKVGLKKTNKNRKQKYDKFASLLVVGETICEPFIHSISYEQNCFKTIKYTCIRT